MFPSLMFLILSCRSEKVTWDLESVIIENATDPLIQIAYLEELIAQDTTKAVKLCRKNSDSLAHIQSKCQHLLQRPHLFQQLKEGQSDEEASKIPIDTTVPKPEPVAVLYSTALVFDVVPPEVVKVIVCLA